MKQRSRRGFMKAAGASIASAAAVGTFSTAEAVQSSANDFTVVENSPTTKTLFSAVNTDRGPFAVGAGGDVIARRADGWEKVVEYGPQARSRPLRGADVTDDGKAVWFVGGSGVIGEYRVDTDTLTNYSAPRGKTSTWEDCAVVGEAGQNERLYFVNGSGELLIGVRQDSGAVKYRDVTKPGGGSTIPGIDFHARKNGHVISTSQFVAETSDGGIEWNKIGIGFAGGAFFDVASVSSSDVNVAAGNGIVYRYDGFRWTPHVIDDERQAIRGIDRDGDEGLAAGAGGKVYERRSAGQWTTFETPTQAKLNGVASGPTYDVAVGAGGTIVERTVADSESDATDGSTNATNTSTNTTDTTTNVTNASTNMTNASENVTNASTNVTDTSGNMTNTSTSVTNTSTNTTNTSSTAASVAPMEETELGAGAITVAVNTDAVSNVVEGTWVAGGPF